MSAPLAPPEPLTAAVAALKRAWRDGDPPDAAAAVAAHPDLLRHRSLAVELAYEEYCLREEAGATPPADSFCRRFPAFRSHLREVIRGHRFLADHPDALAPPWPEPPAPFEGLALVRELGRGAFARAYLARDPETGDRPVVLKLAPARSAEGRTLGPLNHPHVIGVHWSRPAGGLYAVCMPFAGTVTLQDAVARAFAAGRPADARPLRPDPVPELPDPPAPLLTGREGYAAAAAAVFARLADAVAYLHRHRVAHGDLKPSNVLLAPGGHPYLIDFNLAAGAGGDPRRVGGTLPYMAPERLRHLLAPAGDPPADPAAGDVYALGAVLFETLTGRVPVEPDDRTDPDAAAADLLARLPARRPARAAGVPRPLAALIDRCLAADPSRRPTADEVRRRLDAYRTRGRRLARAAAVLAVAAAAAVVWATPGRPPAVPDPPPAAPARPPATAAEFFARGLARLRANDVPAAAADFTQARGLRPGDGRAAAYLAYCKMLGNDYPAARWLFERAAAEGYTPAWEENDRAFCLMQADPELGLLGAAVTAATAALRQDPTLRPARLNRAVARMVQRGSKVGPADPEPIEDIQAVIRGGLTHPEVYVDAAVIAVQFGGGTAAADRMAVEMVTRAIDGGIPPARVRREKLLRPVIDRVGLPPPAGEPGSIPVPQLDVGEYFAPPPLDGAGS
jgi:hypothetical protein